MADKTISGLAALPGNLDPAALIAIVQSGVTYKATGQQVIDLVFGNISVSQLNELLKHNVELLIQSNGDVDQPAGRLPITVTRTGTGTYSLVCPTGRAWRTAIGGGASSEASRSVSVVVGNPWEPSRTATVYVRDGSGALVNSRIAIIGSLRTV